MIKFVIPFLFLISCTTAEQKEEQHSETKPEISVDTKVKEEESVVTITEDETEVDVFSIATFLVEGQGWGYKILNNEKLFINQPHIPSLPGNAGFETKEKALKTAEYIVYKLENGLFPPTISPEELDSLGVLLNEL